MPPSDRVRRLREGRLRSFVAVVWAGFAAVGLGLVRLQVAQHEEFRQLAKENHVRLEVLRAPRGAIYDRNGELLADSAPSFSVVFRPFPAESVALARRVQTPDWLERVARVVETDTSEVHRLVQFATARGQSAALRRNASFAVRAAVEELHEELPGIELIIEPLRRYPNDSLAAHLLGYAGEIGDIELDSLAVQGYRAGDLIGRTGVERAYEEILRGQDGAEFVVVNASGRRMATWSEGPPQLPVPGHDLVLTVDLKVQRALERAMANVEKGAAVALDPRDGSVLGLVSRPAFDPNEFSVGINRERWRELSSGGANPLLNRAIQGVYPPGSTFKIVSMMASLRSDIVHADTRLVPCSGRYWFGGRSFNCWKRTGHGSLDFVGALQHSCDVYFYQIGPRLGLDRLESTARAFGLGDRTGIDLPQEKKGLIPDQAWYDRRWGAGNWRKGTMLNLAIGQGELLLTPLQLAVMVSEAAMNGRAIRPHVVKEVRGAQRQKPEKPGRSRVAAENRAWRALHAALELVVESGTGTAARVPGVRVAGKTGTAQNPHGEDHALFVCYAPANDPTIALAFVVENSGHGGSVAAPKAGQVLATIFAPDSQAVVPVPMVAAGEEHGD